MGIHAPTNTRTHCPTNNRESVARTHRLYFQTMMLGRSEGSDSGYRENPTYARTIRFPEAAVIPIFPKTTIDVCRAGVLVRNGDRLMGPGGYLTLAVELPIREDEDHTGTGGQSK